MKKDVASCLEKAFRMGIAKDIDVWDERPEKFANDVERIGRYTSDVLDEFAWRTDKRAGGRKRKWCTGHRGRWEGGWYQQSIIDGSWGYLFGPIGDEDITWFPGVSGFNIATASAGEVMGAVQHLLTAFPSPLRPRTRPREYLKRPEVAAFAFEVGYPKSRRLQDPRAVCIEVNRWAQFFAAANMVAIVEDI